MVRVQSISPSSIGSELGVEPGTELHTVDGRAVHDFLDWEFLTAEDHFVVRAKLPDGEFVDYDIERSEDTPLGITLEPPRIRRCANRCDFCFVDGLPEGLRQTLYIRDDDYRLSFRYGNFATLTNLKQKDIDRILEYRLSPLYISVHAADPVIRRRILRNPRAPDVIPQLRMFAGGGIRFHTQIVLQPGINDDLVLLNSLSALYALGETVLSVAVVPVGLTSHSRHDLVHEPGREECRDALGIIAPVADRALTERGRRWVYGSDELYTVGEVPLPPAASYDGFDQVENGVGSVRYLQTRILENLPALSDLSGLRIGVLTGTAMGPLMPQVIQPLQDATGGEFEVLALTNLLFGPSVTTAALLPGAAFTSALERGHRFDFALLPAEALNDERVFIDGMSEASLRAASPCEVRLSHDFVDALPHGASV